MTDHIIHLPGNFQYVYQFDGGSQYKCVEASLAMAGQIAYPTRYGSPKQLMSQIYTHYVGPDVAGDRQGTQFSQAIDWLNTQHIGHIVMDCSNLDTLKNEIQAMNLAGVPQIISIGDEGFLKNAKTGQILHNWADSLNHGSHTMLRVGYGDSEGYGLYYEPAAAPQFAQPVPIHWQDFIDGHVVSCIAVFPAGMTEYPPKPKPPAFVFDKAKAESTLAAALSALNNLAHDLAELKQEV